MRGLLQGDRDFSGYENSLLGSLCLCLMLLRTFLVFPWYFMQMLVVLSIGEEIRTATASAVTTVTACF